MTAEAVAAASPANANQPLKNLYEVGEIPPLGHVPEKMYAWCIRQERHGAPDSAMQIEVVPTWTIGEDECL
ncbi:MAG TPA: crotonyl-CoA carboxylase/reductase, partial [Kiloniellales bacterium]